MDAHHDIPFRIGQEAEAKTFEAGYRSAWFRCKITDIALKQGHISYAMEYFDFPDEKISSVRLYQRFHMAKGSVERRKLHLMVRPHFPQSYLENEEPNLDNVSEVMVICRNIWKVGDLVDWWCQGCYWSGQITDVLGKDKVQIALCERPLGEGGSYEALCKDLRPSLEWSFEDGWTVPKSKGENETTACARLIIPLRNDNKDISYGNNKLEEDDNTKPFCKTSLTISSNPSADMLRLHERHQDDLLEGLQEEASYTDASEEEKLQENEGVEVLSRDNKIGFDAVMVPTTADEMAERAAHGKLILPKKRVRIGNSERPEDHKTGKLGGTVGYPILDEEGREAKDVPGKGSCTTGHYNFRDSSNRWTVWRKELNLTTYPDTTQSSLLALEELINKIKWLNSVLQFGSERTDSRKASWQFLDNHDPSCRNDAS